MPVIMASTKVNAMVRRSSEDVSPFRPSWPGMLCTSTPDVHALTSRPASAPRIASTKLSARSCRITSLLEAPSARRIAISFCRPRPRATRRFATFAQAMSSTSPTIAIRT